MQAISRIAHLSHLFEGSSAQYAYDFGDCEPSDEIKLPEPDNYLSPEGVAEVIRLKLQISEMEMQLAEQAEQLADQQNRLRFVESIVPSLLGSATYFEVRDAIERVKSITASLFSRVSGPVEHEDCEVAGERYFEFAVKCNGDVDKALAKHHDWHASVSALPPNVRSLFRLSFDD
ncbi:MAG: hypothetical protein IT427_10200 [Pirellulales bacterium]|nr:hypothetical protein [Pirellulales bacterium]